MIISKENIKKEIKRGNIKISPFNKKNLGPASYDLSVGNEFRVFNSFNKSHQYDFKKLTRKIRTNKIILKPNEFVLGITSEKIKLPDNICAWLTGRSSFARLGLIIDTTAPFIQPGIDNKQVFELKNVSPNPIMIKKGMKIAQIIFQRMEGKAKYKGRYKKQTSI